MKISITLIVLIITVISCSSDKEINTSNCPDKWVLTEMSGNVAGVKPDTGNDMAWQEWYLLFPDHKFTKTRQRNDTTKEQTGTYAFTTSSNGDFLEFTYQLNNDLIGTCTSDLKEYLVFQPKNKLTNSWNECDGPGLIYEKVKYNCAEE